MSLLQSNLRKQIQKIAKKSEMISVKIIHNYSLLFIRVLSSQPAQLVSSRLTARRRRRPRARGAQCLCFFVFERLGLDREAWGLYAGKRQT